MSYKIVQFVFVTAVFCFVFSTERAYSQKTYTTDSQKAIKLYEAGKSAYRYRDFDKGIEYLQKAINVDNSFQEPYMVLAELYWDKEDYDKAIDIYNKGLIIDPSFYPTGYSNKAKLEIKTGKYNEAKASFEQFLSLGTTNKKYIDEAEKGIAQAEWALKAMEQPVDFEPIRLPETVNSIDDEYWPTLSADGKTLIITRLLGIRTDQKLQEDFYISNYDSLSGWQKAIDAGDVLNTNDNEGAQSISANGRTMVYTVCNRPGIIGRCDLFISEKFGDTWSEPQNMGNPINTKYKETQPSLSSDGRTLYFVSDRPGGFGKLDIWMSTQDVNGRWGTPVNLGDKINTPDFESSPFIHHDNKTLYFSSNGHIGMGGFDLFIARKDENGKWSNPENLGYPINTFKDEIGLIVDAKGDRAYFSSNVSDSTGKDIYQFELYKEVRPNMVSYLQGKVYDGSNHKALKASFELYDLKDGSLIAQSFSDIRNGEFLICLPTNRNYMLNVSHPDYLFYSENFSLEGVFELDHPFYKKIPLHKITKGSSVVLKNIFYETDSFDLQPESFPELEKVVAFLNNNSSVRIEISGHTDNQGSVDYNLNLSQKRAQAVVDYLISKGIEANRLVSKGYGFSKPIESNDTPEGMAKNRRTEMVIL